MINGSKTDYGLLVLAEELGEMQKEVLKALRFGLLDRNPKTQQTNLSAIADEFADVVGALHFLKEGNKVHNLFRHVDWKKVDNKVAKINHYYEYSYQKGWG